MKSCFFIGHRNLSEEYFPSLAMAVMHHIEEYGVTDFLVGNYGAFDRMAAKAVILAKQKHPHVTLTLLLPYHPGERPVVLPPRFDGSFYPPGMEKAPRRLAILRANKYAVMHSDYLIAGVWHAASNARNLFEEAQSLEEKGRLHVCNVCKAQTFGKDA